MLKKIVIIVVGVLVVVFVLVQLLPVDRTNPPVTQEVAWDSPEVEAMVRRACYDCHSNETVWPWYSTIAPASLLVARDVREGRSHLNFSEWDRANAETIDVIKAVKEGEMPLPIYLPMHPEARLSEDELGTLIVGLESTLQNDPPISE